MQMHTTRVSSLLLGLSAVAAAALWASAPHPAIAQTANLQGAWSGSGRVVLPSGDAERARCRATFQQQSARTFSMSAVCATASTRIAQVARVQRVSASKFEGQFYNREHDISGTIRISVQGDRLSASLSGGGGRGTFSLSR